LVGAIFPEIIIDGQFQKEGILLYCFEQMPHYLLRDGFDQDGEALIRASRSFALELTERLDEGEGSTSLFLMFDAMLPHIGLILEELYLELADRVAVRVFSRCPACSTPTA
jgi:hypothetical protein